MRRIGSARGGGAFNLRCVTRLNCSARSNRYNSIRFSDSCATSNHKSWLYATGSSSFDAAFASVVAALAAAAAAAVAAADFRCSAHINMIGSVGQYVGTAMAVLAAAACDGG